MRNERVVATCGCICELSADYNWVDESICDVEINIIEIVCDYHRTPQRDSASNAKEDELRQLVSYAIHHLSCGYTNNINRMDALRHLQRRLLAVDAAILEEAIK